MRTQVLIDAIVRQTTVLIARISTAEGARSPLGHIAGELFSGLVAELEHQGVRKKVIADMFGMALRSYRQKVQRLGESATSRGMTLWSAVQEYLAESESSTRTDLLERFRHDDEASVRGILNDLVESGFVVRSGRGEETHYRLSTEEELRDFGAALNGRSGESVAALIWIHVYREGPVTVDRMRQLVPLPGDVVEEALSTLTADGRVRAEQADGATRYTAEQVLIPVGETAGWEAAIVDHHRAVANALAAKITSGTHGSAARDEVGGTTLTFDLWAGHPKEQEVRRLLASSRSTILPLWEEVTAYNKANPAHETYQVHFYCGQYLVADESLT
jgi:hypothetical protein